MKNRNVSVIEEIQKITKGKQNGDLFPEVRQRCAAYKYYMQYYKKESKNIDLDDAYRFLYSSVDPYFIVFCADKEKMNPIVYVKQLLHIDKESYISEIQSKKSGNKYLKRETKFLDEISKLKAAIAGAMPYLVLYDGGRYDHKEDLIENIYKARSILDSADPENHKYVIEMFENWKKISDAK